MEIDKPPLKKIGKEDIDLIALIQILWKGKVVLLKSIIGFGIVGLLVAIYSPKEYVAKSVIVPQVGDNQSKLGGLSSLAAMAGFNLNTGNAGSDLSPTLYPQIINSIPFQLELMNTPLNFSGSPVPVTVFDYFIKESKLSVFENIEKYTIGNIRTLIFSVKGNTLKTTKISAPNQPIHLNFNQLKVKNILSKNILLEVNAKDGYLSLSARMSEPIPAAQLLQRAQELLQQYIIEFKIKKTKANLDFVQQRFDEAAKEYNLIQFKLAGYQDRNKNVSSAIVNTEQAKLQTQFGLISGVYTELAKQLEQAKIQVKQDTPVFTVIEPVSVPNERSKPKRAMILLIWFFLGGVFGTFIIFGKEFFKSFRKLFIESED